MTIGCGFAMKKFEYCIHGASDAENPGDLIKHLDAMGNCGWEVYSVLNRDAGGFIFFMKREIENILVVDGPKIDDGDLIQEGGG